MSTDIDLILANLTSFYDFRNKIVVRIGALTDQKAIEIPMPYGIGLL